MSSLRGVTDCGQFWEKLTTQTGECAFDIGANGGVLSRHLGQNFSRVVAFEPCAESFQDLETNIVPNVVPVNMACSDHSGELELLVTERSIRTGQLTSFSGLNYGPEVAKRTVACTTVDEATSWYGTPDFVKIDTEGHELPVLWGAQQLIRESAPTLAIEVHDESHFDAIIDCLAGYDHIELLRHNGYERGTTFWNNHFYMWAEMW